MSVQNIKQITITCFFSDTFIKQKNAKCSDLQTIDCCLRQLQVLSATTSVNFFFYFVSNNLIAIKFKNGKEEEKIA